MRTESLSFGARFVYEPGFDYKKFFPKKNKQVISRIESFLKISLRRIYLSWGFIKTKIGQSLQSCGTVFIFLTGVMERCLRVLILRIKNKKFFKCLAIFFVFCFYIFNLIKNERIWNYVKLNQQHITIFRRFSWV